MTTTNSEYLKKTKHRSKNAFDRANPEFLKNILGNEKKLRQVREVQERSKAIRMKLIEHCKKHRSNWVSKEAVKVMDEDQRPKLNYPKPSWAADHHNVPSYMADARRRVESRIKGRIKRVGEIERNMQSRIAKNVRTKQQNQTAPRQSQNKNSFHLKSDVHHLVSRTQGVRNRAEEHFRKHKNQWIDNARKQGSLSPEKDVQQKQHQRITKINQAQHRMMNKTFKDHGQSIPKQQAPALKREFNQTM